MPDFLSLADLYRKVDASKVIRYVDDDGDGQMSATELSLLEGCMEEAEGRAYALLIPAFGSSSTIITLMQNDAFLRGSVAWMALELASERRPEFAQAEGWGAYKIQYERAVADLKQQGKGRERSQGESTAGTNAQVGGTVSPTPPAGRANQFVWAPNKANTGGSGGF
jgi:hypothetical protein